MADDGSQLLTGPGVGELLKAAARYAGGELMEWSLEHVDQAPEQSTTATYIATVRWPHGEREELFGVSARSGGQTTPADAKAQIFNDGNRRVAVWLYPNDPELPGLARAAFPDRMAEVLTSGNVFTRPITGEQLSLSMIGYRPRRRAVVKVVAEHQVFYVKVLRERLFADVYRKHKLLLDAGLPAPQVAMITPDFLLVTRELPGMSLARALFEPGDPCRAEDLVALLDAMPQSVATLTRRPPWADAVEHYGRLTVAPLPELADEVRWIVHHVEQGLAHCPEGNEPTHGDFHEGQVRVEGGRVVGILDVDTIGPGRRADDLACFIGHLMTIQRMNAQQTAKVHDILSRFLPVFERRVDGKELRLRAAAVILSLATGPYRSQEPQWAEQTRQMVRSASGLVRQVV